MSKGYAEGSALEERLADLERATREKRVADVPLRRALFGSTPDEPEPHFLGWADELDAEGSVCERRRLRNQVPARSRSHAVSSAST